MTTTPETLEVLKKIVEDAKVAMLVTISSDNRLVARPMQLQEVEFDGNVWFLTRKDTDKYEEIKNNDEVNVVIADKAYASISGKAEIVDDIDKKKEVWSKAYEMMFDLEDYTDPNLTLIKIHAETAEYWDTSSTVKSIYNFVKKVVSNDDVKPGKSTNETLDLK